MREFPFIDGKALSVLQRIFEKVAKDPEFMADPNCPYPGWLKDVFAHPASPESDYSATGESAAILRIQRLLDDLDLIRDQDITKLEPAQQNTIFRVSASLLKDWEEQLQRFHSMKKARLFMAGVVSLLEEMVPEEITGEFITRVRALASSEVDP